MKRWCDCGYYYSINEFGNILNILAKGSSGEVHKANWINDYYEEGIFFYSSFYRFEEWETLELAESKCWKIIKSKKKTFN